VIIPAVARPSGNGTAADDRLPIRSVHPRLAVEGVTVRLVPGTVGETLPVAANTLTRTDLLLIGPGAIAGGLAEVWRFVPRMVGPQTTIVVCDVAGPAGERTLRTVTLAELAVWATTRAEGYAKAG